MVPSGGFCVFCFNYFASMEQFSYGFLFFKILFIFGCAGSVAASGLSSCVSGGCFLGAACGLRIVVAALAVEHRP